uniref:Ribonuclease H-like domain-containing protein n=1 Tax=Tanacetum cinerariifolium TaxID=118510 RepID=A0A699GMV3_TANCI|nr:ribonuclease H-like domain-containing protein [Tanacetum cinerariifolium]
MSTSKFSEVHNMVAFLSKPTETNAKVKSINGEEQLHAKVDGKKVVISKASIRRDLHFGDKGGVDCLPNEVIFEQLTLMGMVKHLDNVNKFLMYLRFVQVFLNNQLEEMSNHTRIYVASCHTKKIFGNMKRVRKGFSGRVTHLFPTMMLQDQEEIGEDEAVNEEMDDRLLRTATTASSLEAEQDSGDTIAQTRSENVSKFSNDPLLNRVIDLETTKITQALEIDSLKRRVKKLEKKKRSSTHGLKRLYKVGLSARVESSDDDQSLGRINDEKMFDTDVLDDEEVFAESIDVAEQAKEIITDKDIIDDITLAKDLMKIKKSTQEGSSKRASDELEQERSKKEKVEDEKESKELKKCLENIPDDGDDVTIDATPLSVKFEKVQPVDHMDSFSMHNLKTMFEHPVEDNVWKNQQGLVKVKNWKLFDPYGVHCVTMQNTLYYLLVEKMKRQQEQGELQENAVPPPNTGLFMPLKPDLSYISLEEFTSEPVVETLNAKTSEEVPKRVNTVRNKRVNTARPKVVVNTARLKVELNAVKGNMSYLIDYKEINRGYVAFGGNLKGGKTTGKGNQSNGNAGIKACDDVGKSRVEIVPGKDYILIPLWTVDPSLSLSSKSSQDAGFKPSTDVGKKVNEVPRQDNECKNQEEKDSVNNTNRVNTVSSTVNTASNEIDVVGRKLSIELLDDPDMPELEDISIFEDSNEDVFGAEANLNNLESPFQVRLVAQGHTQEEGIDYNEVFATVARIEAIRLFLAYASFKDFMVYQIDVKSDFLYGRIEGEVYVCQPPGFKDPDFSDKVYKVEKALCGLHQAPRACQDKYVIEILKKHGFLEVKNANTPMETQKPLLKDEDGEEVDVHMYRSMIGSLMYLTSSRPNINLQCVHVQDTKLIVKNINGKAHLHAKVDGKKVVSSKASIRRDLQFGDDGGVDCLPNEVIFEQPTFATTAWNEFSSTMASIIICLATNQKFNFSKYIFDSMVKHLDNVNKFLMYPRKRLFRRITPLFLTMMVQAQEEIGEGKPREMTLKYLSSTESVVDEAVNKEMDDRLVKAATTTSSLEAEQDIGVNTPRSGDDSMKLKELMKLCTNLQNKVIDLETTKITQALEIVRVESLDDDQSLEMFDMDLLDDEEVFAESVDVAKQAKEIVVDKDIIDDITLDKALMEIKSAKPNIDKVVTQEPEQERLEAEEQEQLTDAKKPKLFMEFLEKRGKFFAAKRAEEKRNRPPKKSQQRSIMCTYLKKHGRIQAQQFEEQSSKKVEAKITHKESSKRAGDKLEQETAKKQKIVDDKETTNQKQLVKIIPEEDIAIDIIPLAVKTSIIDWKIYKEGKKSYYQIIRAGKKSKNYLVFGYMLKDFNKEDVKTLWKLLKAKYKSTRPEEDYYRVLWGNLKVMFKPYTEDEVWKMQQRYKVNRKKALWGWLTLFMNSNVGEYIIFGDLNVVRCQNERSGIMFCHQSADDFNSFIDLNDLVDVHIGGRKFIRISEHGRKMAKLDRFLVSEGFNITVKIPQDFGFYMTVKDAWNHYDQPTGEKLNHIDALLDDGTFNQTLVETRIDTTKSIYDLDERSKLDEAQKIKRKWDTDEDEKSKFLHNLVKKQRHKMMVSGILKDGQWVREPGEIKKEFFDFFNAKFRKFQGARFLYPNERFKQLDSYSRVSLLSKVTLEEINNVVWLCGKDHAHGPDGFSFKTLLNLSKSNLHGIGVTSHDVSSYETNFPGCSIWSRIKNVPLLSVGYKITGFGRGIKVLEVEAKQSTN